MSDEIENVEAIPEVQDSVPSKPGAFSNGSEDGMFELDFYGLCKCGEDKS